jgi:hypothetical protein
MAFFNDRGVKVGRLFVGSVLCKFAQFGIAADSTTAAKITKGGRDKSRNSPIKYEAGYKGMMMQLL